MELSDNFYGEEKIGKILLKIAPPLMSQQELELL